MFPQYLCAGLISSLKQIFCSLLAGFITIKNNLFSARSSILCNDVFLIFINSVASLYEYQLPRTRTTKFLKQKDGSLARAFPKDIDRYPVLLANLP